MSTTAYFVLDSPVENVWCLHVKVGERALSEHNKTDQNYFQRAQELGDVEFVCLWRIVLAHNVQFGIFLAHQVAILLKHVAISARIALIEIQSICNCPMFL